MADIGERYTEQKVKTVRKRLDAIYTQAVNDIMAKTDDFWRRHQVKDAIYRRRVENGQMSEEDYQAWLRGQVFQGQQWQAKRDQITQTLVDADKLAQNIVNNDKLDIFTANANYIGYDIEHNMRSNIGFNIYNSSTVARLIRDEPYLLPAIEPDKINEGMDVAWYQKMITNSITQGIIQGESIGQIAHRITSTCADRAENAAIRDARTAYTGAQNAGRLEGMHQADELGVEVKKQWMATFDFKTRDTHRELDGQIQNIDDPFIVDGDEIMYPGDRHAEPALVYNCRCRLRHIYPRYSSGQRTRRDNITGEDVGNMTYREWFKQKSANAEVASE